MITKPELEKRLKTESLRAIARSLGVTHQTLQQYRRKWGCKPLRKTSKKGSDHHSWRGGSFISARDGYKMILCPGKSTSGLQYVAEHVLVAETMLGRLLKRGEVVHHINGQKADNRPDNLLVCSQAEHLRLHRELESIALQLFTEGSVMFQNGHYIRV